MYPILEPIVFHHMSRDIFAILPAFLMNSNPFCQIKFIIITSNS
jgi:hypothetical protein